MVWDENMVENVVGKDEAASKVCEIGVAEIDSVSVVRDRVPEGVTAGADIVPDFLSTFNDGDAKTQSNRV